MPQRRRAAAVWALAFAVPLLPACGGSGDSPTRATPPTTTPGPVETIVASGATFVPVRVAILIPFETTATGTIDVTVDWTDRMNEIDLYLLSGSCTPQQWPRQCTFVTFSESREFKPERLRMVGAFAGPYVLAIGNIGPFEESVSYQVVLTTGGLRGQ